MVADLLAGRGEPLVLDYHNVTGSEHYAGWEPATARRAAQARQQLARLAPRAALGLADSPYNEADLRAAGCRATAVVPVLVDYGRLGAPDPRVAGRLAARRSAGGADWLFVGRLVPSKAQHELVKALWAYRRLYDPEARLHLVGSAPSARYLAALRGFVDDVGLAGAVRLPGEVSDAALAAYFEAADVYVSLSVHEGFGVPLVEAMAAGVPVVARAAGAVAGTVGDAGVLLDRADPLRVAAAVHRVLGDPGLADRLRAAGRRRAAQRSLAEAARAAVTALASVAGAPPAGLDGLDGLEGPGGLVAAAGAGGSR
jgi:glycosyltransferase involved in cell wall biosynthesis